MESEDEMVKYQNEGQLISDNSRKKFTKNIKNCAKRLTGEAIPIKIKWKTYNK